MTISEINKILKDPKMQDKNTNFKVLISKGGSKITAAFVLQQLKESNLLILNELKETKTDLLKAISNLDEKLTTRIDNLVIKNNLKE